MAVSILFCLGATSVFAKSVLVTDSNGIVNVDFLDFSEGTNDWAAYNEETGAWEGILKKNPEDDDFRTAGAYLLYASDDAEHYSHLNWSLEEGGEVLKLVAKDTNKYSGMPFSLDAFAADIPIGKESSNQAEYVKIRIRNSSSSTKIGFGFIPQWTNSLSRSISVLDIDANMSGWTTYTFSMQQLCYDQRGEDASWGGMLKSFYVFPFGYGDQSEVYEGAMMEIDYVVIGSYEYVQTYESALEKKENSATAFEAITLPSKTTYYTGDKIDLSGLSAKITYADGTTETVSSAAAVYNFETEGTTTVKLVYGKQSISYDVTIVGVESVSVATQPEAKSFKKTDVLMNGFTPTGLSIKVDYKDGTSQIKELGEFNIEETDFDQVGDYIITANFFGTKTTFNIKLIDIAEFSFTPNFDKLYYGTEINADSFDISCVYTDGSSESLADTGLAQFLVLTYNTKIAGGTTLATATINNAAYGLNLSQNIELTVETPVALEVNAKQAIASYNVDAKINTTGLKVSYKYADNETANVDVTDPVLKLKYDFSAPGTATVKVVSGNLSDSYEVKVKDASFLVDPAEATGTISLLKAKFPTGLLALIIIIAIVVVFGGLFCYLKFVKKVSFKPKRKRASLDDIF